MSGMSAGGGGRSPRSGREVKVDACCSSLACSRHSSLTRTKSRRSSRLLGASLSASMRSDKAVLYCLETRIAKR